MEPDTHIRTKYCKNCKNRINMMNFDVHSAQCVPPPKPPRVRQKKEKRNKIQVIPKVEVPKQEITGNQEEVFPCYLCGFNQTLSDLDTHHLTCPNRQVKCNYCSSLFPTCIINDHKAICPYKPRALSIPPQAQLPSAALSSVQNANNSQTVIRPVTVNPVNSSQSMPMTVNRNPPSVQVRPQIIANQNIFTANLANNPPNIFIPRPFIPSQPSNSQLQSQGQLPPNIRISNQTSSHSRPNVPPPSPPPLITRIERNQTMNLPLNTHQSSNNSTSQSRSLHPRPQQGSIRNHLNRHISQESRNQHQRPQQIAPQTHLNRNTQTSIATQSNEFRNFHAEIQRRRFDEARARNRLEMNDQLEEINRRRILLRLQHIRELANRHNSQHSHGLRKQEIAKILDKKYNKAKEEEPQNCSICYCQILQNQLIKDLPCKHLYHTQCISKWLTINTACPLCKFDIATLVRKNQEERNAQLARVVVTMRGISWFHENDDEQGDLEDHLSYILWRNAHPQ